MLRGVFSAVAMLIATMVVVAAIDFHFFLSDRMRWVLSSVAYVSVLVIAWRQCIYQLLHAPNERQIARLVEHAEPKLREDLLSAVELNESEGKVFDSEQFRELLRTDVSARMQGLEVKSLLPVALIKRSLAIAVVISGSSTPKEFAIDSSALVSFGKHDPPQPGPGSRNLFPIRVSRPMPCRTSYESAPTASQSAAMSFT